MRAVRGAGGRKAPTKSSGDSNHAGTAPALLPAPSMQPLNRFAHRLPIQAAIRTATSAAGWGAAGALALEGGEASLDLHLVLGLLERGELIL